MRNQGFGTRWATEKGDRRSEEVDAGDKKKYPLSSAMEDLTGRGCFHRDPCAAVSRMCVLTCRCVQMSSCGA